MTPTTKAQAIGQHTAGPWTVDFELHYSGAEGFSVAKGMVQSLAIRKGRKVIAAVIHAWRKPDPEAQADARLIASAPDLLAALEALETATKQLEDNFTAAALNELCEAQDQAKGAIAKARGGAE